MEEYVFNGKVAVVVMMINYLRQLSMVLFQLVF